MKKNENLKERYLEFQINLQQLNKLNQHFALINEKINELHTLDQNLTELNSIKENQEILVPFGAGILIKASIKDTKDLLMNVGSNVVVKKSASDSKKIIQQQILELEKALAETEKEILNLSTSLELMQKELKDSTHNE